MFERYLTAYLEHLAAKGYAPGTRGWHRIYLQRFLAWIGEREAADPKAVTTDNIQDYLLYLRTEYRTKNGRSLADRSLEANRAAVAGFFRWLWKTDQILLNPAAGLRRDNPHPLRLPQVLTEEEALRILECCPINTPVGLRNRAILELLYSTGIRRGELIRLNVKDFSPEREELAIVEGKGRKDRVAPVGEYAKAFTEGYLKLVRPWQVTSPTEEALFINSRTGERLSALTVYTLVKAAARKAGVKKRVSPHTFRHSMATHLLRNKADLRHIQAILGHGSPTSTAIYTHLTAEDLKEMIERSHPRGRR